MVTSANLSAGDTETGNTPGASRSDSYMHEAREEAAVLVTHAREEKLKVKTIL